MVMKFNVKGKWIVTINHLGTIFIHPVVEIFPSEPSCDLADHVSQTYATSMAKLLLVLKWEKKYFQQGGLYQKACAWNQRAVESRLHGKKASSNRPTEGTKKLLFYAVVPPVTQFILRNLTRRSEWRRSAVFFNYTPVWVMFCLSSKPPMCPQGTSSWWACLWQIW